MSAIVPYLGGSYKFSLGLDDAVIGDPQNDEFKPTIELTRWNREARLKLTFDDSKLVSKNIVLEDNKVKFSTPPLDIHYYPINPTEQYEDGGVELEIILKQKPSVNVIGFSIEIENLAWYYQPPLTEEFAEKDCLVWTETRIVTKEGDVAFRPENVVGSYAVYHSSKQNNEYRAGKAFHLYRPQLKDALGNTAWATLNVTNNVLTATLPQNFLDKAVYPVTVDPTFGYQTQGASTRNLIDADSHYDEIRGTAYSCSESGTLTSITAYLTGWVGGDQICEYGLYKKSDNSLVAVSGEHPEGHADGWVPLSISGSLTAQDYVLCARGEHIDTYTAFYISFDSVSAYRYFKNAASILSFPNPFDGTTGDSTYKYSIYAAYTTGGVLKEVTDSLGLSDSVFGHKALAISDLLGLSDATPRRDKAFSILDAAYLSEQAPLTDRALPVSDAVALSESLLTNKNLTILDQTSLSDFSIVNKIREILDSVELFEQILVELGNLTKIVAIKKAIISLLKADEALQSLLTKDENDEYPIYHAYAQPKIHAPCVTVGDITDSGEASALGYGFDGSKRYEWRYALIQIDCWSNTGLAERDALQSAVEDCLVRNSLDEALFASEESVLSLDDYDTKPPLWRKNLRFKVMYILEA